MAQAMVPNRSSPRVTRPRKENRTHSKENKLLSKEDKIRIAVAPRPHGSHESR